MEKISTKTGGSKIKRGLIIGKFLPPHLGHQYLIDFGRNYVDELYVLVCSLKAEPIKGELRFKWMKEMFPDVNIIHVKDENPQYPEEHPKFWNIWKKTIQKVIPKNVDYLFASENYGFKLAEVLDMTYIPVDHDRELMPISGTKIREKPFSNWNYIPPAVRPYFLKKVCVFGPESTGKSTLTKKLAKHFKTVYVSEYARGLLNFKNGQCDYKDILLIAKGHSASEKALEKRANKLMFSDTDMVLTTLWSKVLFGKCFNWVESKAEETNYDLYLLLNVDVPWVDDNQRYFPHEKERKHFFNMCLNELKERKKNFIIISGESWDKRFKSAVKEVKKLLKE